MKIITGIAVNELYGEYNHKINTEKDLTIIYGPNGVGKTTILEIAKLLVSGNFSKLSNIAFKDAYIEYSDNSRLIFSKFDKTAEKIEILNSKSLIQHQRSDSFDHFDPANLIVAHETSQDEKYIWSSSNDKPLLDWIEENTSWSKINDYTWRDSLDGEIRTQEEIIDTYHHRRIPTDSDPAYLDNDCKIEFNSDSIHLIETQRLKIYDGKFNNIQRFRNYPRTRQVSINETKISQISQTIVEKIREAQRENSFISQKLERTFPARVLSSIPDKGLIEESEVREKYNEQMGLRDRLEKIIPNKDRIGSINLPERKFNSADLKLLQIYLADTKQKLKPFSALVDKIELFTRIVNDRLSNKEISIDPRKGIILTKSNGVDIPLISLSSGEQHEVIMMAELIFNVKPGTLVLIDEPEISLHVSWQYKFIPDVLEISKIADFRFLIATHSPQIIDNNMNLAQRLGSSNLRWDEKN